MTIPSEVVFYIHGVSGSTRGGSHSGTYQELHDGVAALNPAWPTHFGGAEWGWNHAPGRPASHELLADAQRLLGSRALPDVLSASDFTLNPARLVIDRMRNLFLYGFGDMFYYVSEQGKQAVRLAVARQIIAYLPTRRLLEENTPISLTLLGHSAGSVVAFDFLFYLFHESLESPLSSSSRRSPRTSKKKTTKKTKKNTTRAGGGDSGAHGFLKRQTLAGDRKTDEGLQRLAEMAHDGTLRIRRLFTFGSPITPVACRSDRVLEILAADHRFEPSSYGFDRQLADGAPLEGPRWINLWDRDDPIGWPVQPLMQESSGEPLVKDVYADVSDLVSKAHDRYWRSRTVHQVIAAHW
ncbi:MAG: hypothetical protein SYC29_14035 [Planctomycetota bacterium]|nr:hypothetical protein [Planctomycetota bacterium]